jgi:hypothetical protein
MPLGLVSPTPTPSVMGGHHAGFYSRGANITNSWCRRAYAVRLSVVNTKKPPRLPP